jgi:hypothetical protein
MVAIDNINPTAMTRGYEPRRVTDFVIRPSAIAILPCIGLAAVSTSAIKTGFQTRSAGPIARAGSS